MALLVLTIEKKGIIMNAYERIQYYVDVYCGSEKRIIENVVSELIINRKYRKESDARNAVEKSLQWLVDENYLEIVPYQEMKDCEIDYYNSDCCTIYRINRRFNELEYIDEQCKKSEAENKLETKDRVKLYFDKMKKKILKLNPAAYIGYKLMFDDTKIEILQDDVPSIIIEFPKADKWYYDEYENYLHYDYNNKEYFLKLECINNCISIRKCSF